jgi:hypothetical protein
MLLSLVIAELHLTSRLVLGHTDFDNCHSERPKGAKPVLSEVEGNLVFGKRFSGRENEILCLRGVYPERSEGLRLRMTDISFSLW